MQTNRSGQARAVLNEVQSRHDDIKKIERTILELHQLFMDMQMMIEQQGEVLTQIEVHAETAAQDLEQGNKDVSRAIVSAKATRAVSRITNPQEIDSLTYLSFSLSIEKMVLLCYLYHSFNRHWHPGVVVCFWSSRRELNLSLSLSLFQIHYLPLSISILTYYLSSCTILYLNQ